MSKMPEPKVYITAYIGSKLAAGRRSNVWPYLPVGQVRDGAKQEVVKQWLVNVQQAKDTDDLKTHIQNSPDFLGGINGLALNELRHYLEAYNNQPE